MPRKIYFIANTMIEPGMSGGTRILIEFAKKWAEKGDRITLFVSPMGQKICEDNGLTDAEYVTWPAEKFRRLGIFGQYLAGTFLGFRKVTKAYAKQKDAIVWSTSDFWPDTLPAFWLKLRNPSMCWIGGFFLFAPGPFQKDSPYKGKNFFKGLVYWLTQLPIYYLVKKWSDYVFVTSEPDVKKFITKKRKKDKIIIIQGGVDITEAKKYLAENKIIPLKERKYDACFTGRFHYQKGVLELIDIWNLVCQKNKEAKLAMIGIGPLEEEIRKKIKKYKLENNIELLGFRDGEDKYKVFKQSKIMVHPATYDSGGMAAAEGMAWGLPGVSFDLEALETYYPKGMVKTPPGNFEKFVENIFRLLNEEDYYNKISKEAIDLTREVWDWNIRADKIYQEVFRDKGY